MNPTDEAQPLMIATNPAHRPAPHLALADLNPSDITEARDWIADVFGHELGFDADALTDVQVYNAIRRHYSGGWHWFIADRG